MSIHIGAEPGQIAPRILLPGDPLRAKFIAETMLEAPVCFNQVRGMLGFTGIYQGQPVSVMGTGMGIPSFSIYAHELIAEYGVGTLIRVGTCGAFQADLGIGDIILAMSASTDSQVNELRFGGMDYAPTASFELLQKANRAAQNAGITVHIGSILTCDSFYYDDPDWWKIWAKYGALVCDMETAALYTLAAKFGVSALSIMTISDNLVTGDDATAEQRERHFPHMARIALDVVTGSE
jgi:purine-nucleoside phosphorylase